MKKLVEDENLFLGDIDVSDITDLSGVFKYSKRSNFIGVELWKVSKATDMSEMFMSCENFNQDLSRWDTGNVTNMRGMFCGCSNFNLPLDKFNTSKVTNMSGMFIGCKKFNQDLSGWDVSKVEKNNDMFFDCPIKDEYKPKFS